MTTISNTDKVIDSRDVIRRIADLENTLQTQHETAFEAFKAEDHDADGADVAGNLDAIEDFEEWLLASVESDYDAEELINLRKLAEEGENSADWTHGETLIADSYFEDYARELAQDIGAISGDEQWPLSYIDWERAADALKMDYFSVDFDGETYWIRS